MFNLIVSAKGDVTSVTKDRILERLYTKDHIRRQFVTADGDIDRRKLETLPVLLVEEFKDDVKVPVRVGYFTAPFSDDVKQSLFIPSFTAEILQDNLSAFSMVEWENTHTHWAVKEGDLFQILGNIFESRPDCKNRINQFPIEQIVSNRVAVMMSFKAEYDDTYETIKQACSQEGYEAKRVDEFYDPTSIPEQIIELINSSAYVIADISELNANVLFEAGYAAGVQKPTILVTSTSDTPVPFDIRHIRYFSYLNNKQGRKKLFTSVVYALQSLQAR
ncbi:hypothetical protein [Bombiscardovia coagulans]|uniref:Nucleoside 2-deoxyribosyltransferase n=1 Tax=Bombiscardovia coagulans TaxID=686666 RepID=A0A261ESG9_9BIFI|nr:hypothetical protein [Bombiscardovia coagulans]OZG49807.1 hypothetical protein BOCO_0324 [Bombiscardovia coagulans]